VEHVRTVIIISEGVAPETGRGVGRQRRSGLMTTLQGEKLDMQSTEFTAKPVGIGRNLAKNWLRKTIAR
jgi:hypothetical protein